MLALASAALLVCVAAAAPAQEAPGEPRPAPDEEPLFSIGSPIGPLEYRAARGFRFGDTGLNLGGFTTFEFDRNEGEKANFEIDAVSLLALFQPVDWLRAFSEIEIGDLMAYEWEGGPPESDVNVEAKRLYGDLLFRESLNLRYGKFQTPVGRWNLVPAEPFVWTAIEPAFTELAFEEHVTGPSLFGSFHPAAGSLDYWVYGQVHDGLDTESSPDPADYTVGGRVEFGSAVRDWSLGASLLSVKVDGDWSHLGGLDGEWQIDRLRLTGELTVGLGDVGERQLVDVYLQGVYRLAGGFHLVGRYERFDPGGSRDDAHIFDVGAAWIPFPFLHLKATYRLTDEQSEEVRRGINASISVVF
ncbi:MAG: hypothetical protein ACQGVK_10870 [Myxococcota bacterium]